ncbi:MAG TPA: hypothetical protein VHD35_02025, partial [Chitinophagaceae bacterium]|nr:hypothetical protein [Chitinophagaceae bacterium]
MKIKLLIYHLLFFFSLHTFLYGQERSNQRVCAGKELPELNSRLATGWNTWYTNSVLSHVLLPAGFAIDLQLLNHQQNDTLKEALIGREDYGTKEHVVPGPHAYDGSYTELTVEWQHINVLVQSAAEKN